MLVPLLCLLQAAPGPAPDPPLLRSREFDVTDLAESGPDRPLPPLRLHPSRDEFDLRWPEEIRLDEIRAVLRELVGPRPSRAVLDAIAGLRPDRLHEDSDHEPAVLALLERAGGPLPRDREAIRTLLGPLTDRPTRCRFDGLEADLVQAHVAPNTWEGDCRIRVLPNGRLLATHRPEVLDEVEAFLKALRSMRPAATVALEAEIRDSGDAPRRISLAGREGRFIRGELRSADRVDLIQFSGALRPDGKAICLDLVLRTGRREGPGHLGVVDLSGSMELRDGQPAVFSLPGRRSLSLRATVAGTPAPMAWRAAVAAPEREPLTVRILSLRDHALALAGAGAMTGEDWGYLVKNQVRHEEWEEADGKTLQVFDGLLIARNSEPILREVEAFLDARRAAGARAVAVEAALLEAEAAGGKELGEGTDPASLEGATRLTLRGFEGRPLALRWTERREGRTAEGRFGVVVRRGRDGWETAIDADVSTFPAGAAEPERIVVGTDVRIPEGRSAVAELSGDGSRSRVLVVRPSAR
jgi:hypothetical protein